MLSGTESNLRLNLKLPRQCENPSLELVAIMAECKQRINAGKDDNELLISGYSRKIMDEHTMKVYPLGIFNVIKRIYLNIILFGWDKQHHGNNIYFESKEDNTDRMTSVLAILF